MDDFEKEKKTLVDKKNVLIDNLAKTYFCIFFIFRTSIFFYSEKKENSRTVEQ